MLLKKYLGVGVCLALWPCAQRSQTQTLKSTQTMTYPPKCVHTHTHTHRSTKKNACLHTKPNTNPTEEPQEVTPTDITTNMYTHTHTHTHTHTLTETSLTWSMRATMLSSGGMPLPSFCKLDSPVAPSAPGSEEVLSCRRPKHSRHQLSASFCCG